MSSTALRAPDRLPGVRAQAKAPCSCYQVRPHEGLQKKL